MKKIVGIVTEYNPFHNGHKYHVEEAKKLAGADYCIAVMSGNFVQRGTPAIIDKYSRTKMALQNGVDLVLELPVSYATGSAEYFAFGAISLLDKLGIVDSICFGSECGDITLLKKVAEILTNASETFDRQLKSFLKAGLAFPLARAQALEQYLKSDPSLDTNRSEQLSKILAQPNNILGIEYIKALNRLSSSIEPITIGRKTAAYHDKELSKKTLLSVASLEEYSTLEEVKSSPVISSATAIRNVLQHIEGENLVSIKDSVPNNVYEELVANYYKIYPVTEEDFSRQITYKLITEVRDSLVSYMDVSQDFADRIKNLPDYHLSMAELVQTLKSRNLTLTRINRSLIHILLNLRKDTIDLYNKHGYTAYARVLGFRKEASHLLRMITDHGRLTVVTKVSNAKNQLSSLSMQMLSEDILATHIYNQVVYEKFGTSLPNEYRRGLVIMHS